MGQASQPLLPRRGSLRLRRACPPSKRLRAARPPYVALNEIIAVRGKGHRPADGLFLFECKVVPRRQR